ncbi:MAG: glycosyltransferase family 9 protein [Bacteroidia bacterium]|nr:glycosyltransferase family 9 protein [Bacteroidia bacterium]
MMRQGSKVLIIRFNSIGDIVLTSPVAKILDLAGYEVHYLSKSFYTQLLTPNPHISKTWSFEGEFSKLNKELKKEGFDYIVDLHNNYRSARIKSAIGVKSFTLSKPRLKLWLLTQFGVNLIKTRHIVYRFMDVISPLTPITKEIKPEFYFSNQINEKSSGLSLPEKYIVICISAAYKTKTIPDDKIEGIINGLEHNIVLLGGKEDIARSAQLIKRVNRKPINFVGNTDVELSAYIIKMAQAVVTGDTGMMHISVALNKPTVAVFGSTHAILGYTPFGMNENKRFQVVENPELKCRPCTKQGKSKCPKGHFKCMIEIKTDTIIEKIQALI